MSSKLPPRGLHRPWSFWDDPNYLNQVLFRDHSPAVDAKVEPVSFLCFKERHVKSAHSATATKNVLQKQFNEMTGENVESNSAKLTHEKAQAVVNKALVYKAKDHNALSRVKSDPHPICHQPSFHQPDINSTHAKTEKASKVVISQPQSRSKKLAVSSPDKKSPKSVEAISIAMPKQKDDKAKKVAREVISTAQASTSPSAINVISSSVKMSPSDLPQLAKNNPSEQAAKDVVASTQEKVLKVDHQSEIVLVISQDISKKITLKDIDDELSLPANAIEYFLKGTLEEELKELNPQERLSVYTKLLQRSVLSFLGTKGELSSEKMNQIQMILNKHFAFLKSELIHKNEKMFFSLLYPLIEICVNSSCIESCHLGLQIMIDFFSQPNPCKVGKEVQLIEKFLINRKKGISNGEGSNLQEAIKKLAKVFLKAAPAIKYAEVAFAFDMKNEPSLIIQYYLAWLKNIHSSSQPHVETPADAKYYDHLIKTLTFCEKEDFEEVSDFFLRLPIDKINFNITKCSVQAVLIKIFVRKLMGGIHLMGGSDIDPEAIVLFEYCANIWKFSPSTVDILKPGFEKYLFSIREHTVQSLPLFMQALELLTSEAELENVIRIQKKLETSKNPPQKTSISKKKKAQRSKPAVVGINEDDVAKNIHFKAASIVFHSLFDSAMRSLPTDKTSRKKILEDLCKLSFKAHINFEFENKSSFLLAYMDSCDLENMDSTSEEIIMNILKVIDCENQLDEPPTDKTTGMFIKKCIREGVKKIVDISEDVKRVTLYNNMMLLTDVLMHCDIERQEKIDVFSLLLRLLSVVVNRDQLAYPLCKIFNRHHRYLYENNEKLYWEHYYNLGNVGEKRKTSKSEDIEPHLTLRREALKTLTDHLSEAKGLVSIRQMLEILKDKELIEFKGHFHELKDCYQIIFDKLSNEKTITASLKLMNNWFKEQVMDDDTPDCIFFKTVPFKNIKIYISESDQKAHRELMMAFFTTYKTVCEKTIESDQALQKDCSETFGYNISYMINMRAFEICDEEDLKDFEKVLNMTYDFMKKYVVKGFSQVILDNLYIHVLGTFTRSKMEGKSFELVKHTFIEKWKNLTPSSKTKRIL